MEEHGKFYHLLKALRHENWRVKENVIKILGILKDRRAVYPLIELLSENERNWIHKTVIEALGEISDSRAIPVIKNALRHKKISIRRRAAEALGKIADKAGLNQLIVALQDDVFEVRRTASYAIEELCKRWDISKEDLTDTITDENLKQILVNYKEETLEVVEERILGLEEKIEEVIRTPNIIPMQEIINNERKKIKKFLERREHNYSRNKE
nr:HEAT repeat domain-containing protein [Candidatus Borrarchaeum sp.]